MFATILWEHYIITVVEAVFHQSIPQENDTQVELDALHFYDINGNICVGLPRLLAYVEDSLS